jgi:hypothetical protein
MVVTRWTLPPLCAVVLVAACSSEESADDDNGSGGSNGPDIVLDDPNSGAYEGGEELLTPEQARALVDAESTCAGWAAEPEGGPATLMMVIDTSRSMASSAPNSPQPKWDVTKPAILQAIESLPGSAWVGLMFYPNEGVYSGGATGDPTACVNMSSLVPVGPLGGSDSEQRQALLAAVNAVEPDGCTPTHGAYVLGLEDGLRSVTNAPPERHMLLITDGQPTLDINCATGGNGGSCSPANPTDKVAIQEEIAAALAADGTRTWVIGSPGSEQNETTGEDVREWLSVAAERGGTASLGCSNIGEPYCHFDMSIESDFGTGLARALASITGQIVGCEYDVPAPPAGVVIDRDAVNLVITDSGGQSRLIKRDGDPTCDVGWYYEGDEVILCSQTCSDVENDAGASLALTFGCTTNEIPEIN